MDLTVLCVGSVRCYLPKPTYDALLECKAFLWLFVGLFPLQGFIKVKRLFPFSQAFIHKHGHQSHLCGIWVVTKLVDPVQDKEQGVADIPHPLQGRQCTRLDRALVMVVVTWWVEGLDLALLTFSFW